MKIYSGTRTHNWPTVGTFTGWKLEPAYCFDGQPIPVVAGIERKASTVLIPAHNLTDDSLARLTAIEPLPDGKMWGRLRTAED